MKTAEEWAGEERFHIQYDDDADEWTAAEMVGPHEADYGIDAIRALKSRR